MSDSVDKNEVPNFDMFPAPTPVAEAEPIAEPKPIELVAQDKLELCTLEREFLKATLAQNQAQAELKRTAAVIATLQEAYKDAIKKFRLSYTVPAGRDLSEDVFDAVAYTFSPKQ